MTRCRSVGIGKLDDQEIRIGSPKSHTTFDILNRVRQLSNLVWEIWELSNLVWKSPVRPRTGFTVRIQCGCESE